MTTHKVHRRLATWLTTLAVVVAGIPVSSAPPDAVRTAHVFQAPDIVIDLKQARASLTKATSNKHAKVVERAKHLLHLLNIHEAATSAERHDLIRSLPVVVTDSFPADGRHGVLRSFAVRGKTQFELFIPAKPRPRAGPMEAPDSSNPAVRGADDCYDGPAPCATPEEMDDLGYLLATTIADVEAAQTEFDNGCLANPEQCEPELVDEEGAGALSGPSVSDVVILASCKSEAQNAVIALAGSASAAIFAYLGYEAAVLSGLSLTALGLAAMATAAFLVSFAAGFAVGVWIACVLALPAGSPTANAIRPFGFELNYGD